MERIEEQPYGWVIVTVSVLCLGLAFGSNLMLSVLVEPFETEFGWSRSDISLSYTMLAIGAGVGGLFWGGLSDRIGVRKIAVFGTFVLSGTIVLIGTQSTLSGMYVLFFLMGLAGFACLFTPLLALTGLWFSRRKGMALGLVTAGGALGQGIIPFVERLMISAWGWREAMLYLGIGYLVLLLPLLLLLKPPPVLIDEADYVSQSDENLWRLPHKITLPWIALGGIFCCITMAAPMVHLVSLGLDIGFDPETAASLLLVMMVSGTFGRIFFGLLADRIGGLHAYFLASFGQTATVFWFTQTDVLAALYTNALVFGFASAGVMTCLIICGREAAPLRLVGMGTAIVSTMGWLGMGIGGYQAGYFFDLNGTYVQSYANAAMAGIVNLIILSALIWYRRRPSLADPAIDGGEQENA